LDVPFEPRSWVNGLDGNAIVVIVRLHC
jgi:hypothetical protein